MTDLGLNHSTNSPHQKTIGGVLLKSTLQENKFLRIKCFPKWVVIKLLIW